MKVFILTEGNSRIGFGHVTRCLALCQAFKKHKILPELLINGDNKIRSILRYENCQTFNWLKEERKTLNLLSKADTVIIDSYLASLKFYNKVSKNVNLSVYMDDFKRLNYPMGMVVSSSVCAKELAYPIKKDMTYLLGIKYVPLRMEFWNASKRKINSRLNAIMVAFGGCDMKNMTIRILRTLIKKYPNMVKNVVIGSAFRHKNVIGKIKDKKTNLIKSPDAEGMKKAMLNSDIAISASGQTLYELARTGTPTVAVTAAENQLNNIKGLENNSFLKYAGRWNEKNLLKKVVECIEELRDKDARLKMSLAGRKNVDGQGAKRIVERILR